MSYRVRQRKGQAGPLLCLGRTVPGMDTTEKSIAAQLELVRQPARSGMPRKRSVDLWQAGF